MKAALAALALLVAQGTQDAGTGQPPRVRITVRAIAATSGAEQTDPRLQPIAKNLAEFSRDFRYRNFQLASEQTLDLPMLSAAQTELPGSRSLQITPRQVAPDGRIQVHLELLGEHPSHSRKLHTDYTIQRGGTIFVGGMRLDPQKPERGMLLIAVTQEVE
ncbi:MAG TPA: hypothetical protein VG496_18535 [Myxococcales bacterium]|nr:hypothetical protein [Myxococcales bacterium]